MALKAPPSAIPAISSSAVAAAELRSVPTAYLAEDARHPTVIIVTSPSQSHHHSQIPPPRPPPPPQHLTLQRSPNIRKEPESIFEQIQNYIIMAFCCLCCPAYKCAILTASLEFILGIYFWFDAVNDVYKNFDELQFKDVAIVFFFTAFCIAAGTALGTLFVAHRKKSPHFVWPRLVFVTGVLIICGILIILLFLYFSGAASGINDFIINVVEFVMKQNFTADDRKGLHHDLAYMSYGFAVLLFFFTCYTLFGWCATKKFYHDLLKDYRNFHPVAQSEPTAPTQPAFNPNYAKGAV
uniref:Uncharacterized protein n=1 Tax=Panagrolaimus sp. PS1159 TaxID=55785 RepID=A0AC35G737_9BILA